VSKSADRLKKAMPAQPLKILALIAVTAAAVWLAGCKRTNPATSPPTHSFRGSNSQFVIGVSQGNLVDPWRLQMETDITVAAAAHSELAVIFKNARNDTASQRTQVGEFVSSRVDLLIISPNESGSLTESVARALGMGIPVIVLDRGPLPGRCTCFIGGDNQKIGRAVGQWAAGALGGKGNVLELMGPRNSPSARDRHRGFLAGLAGSKIHVLLSADTEGLEVDARREMELTLANFSQIDLVFAHDDTIARGAYQAAQAAGREKQIQFVDIDGLPHEGIAEVKQGILAATFQFPTGGAEAIDTALRILHGDNVPPEILLGTRLFTRGNAAQGGVGLP